MTVLYNNFDDSDNVYASSNRFLVTFSGTLSQDTPYTITVPMIKIPNIDN